MSFKSTAAAKPGRVWFAIALVAIIMIVLSRLLYSKDGDLTLYAIPVALAVGAAAIVRETLQNPGEGRKAPGRKISNGLVAVSSAAILTIYAAGYDRTSVAADQFEQQAAASRRRPTLAASIAAKAIPERARAADTSSIDPATTVTDEAVNRPAETPALLPTPTLKTAEAALPAALSAPADASAPPSAVATTSAPSADPGAPEDDYEYADGTFSGRGTSRHGDLMVQLVIQSGKIVSASVSKCMTQYSCDVLLPVYKQLVVVQNPDKIDNVTGATDSVDAYYGGAIKALNIAAQVKAFQKQYKTTK